MNYTILFYTALAVVFMTSCQEPPSSEWIYLFNGTDTTGWKASENKGTFVLENGLLKANGNRSHLFYMGEDGKASFKNFELEAEIMTTYLANSGIYFHTEYQETDWPAVGIEAQINNSHKGGGGYKEVKKGGSLYGVRNVYKALTPDSVWYKLNIKVADKQVQIKVNDQLIVDYIEPKESVKFEGGNRHRLSSGTFALQGHDPNSTVYFKYVKVKKLPDELRTAQVPDQDQYPEIMKLQASNIAVTDMNTRLSPSFEIDQAIKTFQNTGINLGLVTTDINQLKSFYDSYISYPVFLGIYLNDITANVSIDSTISSMYDYIIGKMPNESHVTIPDPQGYMDRYVAKLTSALNKGLVNILSSATLLPDTLMNNYEELWSEKRMDQVIESLKQNQVAVEINPELRLPSIKFIQKAKKAGCLFTLGDSGLDGDLNLDYYIKALEEGNLDYKDIYIPDKLW